MPTKTKGVLYLRRIPRWLKTRFKKKARAEGRTMESIIIQLVTDYTGGPDHDMGQVSKYGPVRPQRRGV